MVLMKYAARCGRRADSVSIEHKCRAEACYAPFQKCLLTRECILEV